MVVERLNDNNSIFKAHTVALEDMPWLLELGEIEDVMFELRRGLTGGKLKTPVSIPISQMLAVGQEGLIRFIVEGLVRERPKLIPFVFRNSTVVEIANYLKRYRSASHKTFYLYTNLLEYFSKWAGREPDEIISDIKPPTNSLFDPAKIQAHCDAFENFVAHLQNKGLAPNRVINYAKAVKAFYTVNGIRNVDLLHPLPRRVVKRDRAPKTEELQKLLDIADLRERVIITLLALGGFREGTLVRLKYRHVKHDLENGIIPLHVHVEAEITKGKYHDYDTFLGAEAVHYLKLYLDSRRKGSWGLSPEEITDESPLIRDAHSETPKPIGEKQIYQLLHRLYLDAGLNQKGETYKLKVHSIRKFFKTQLLAVGVQPDYVDYMMGHTVDTYHDVQNRIEDLRRAYAAADLSPSPKPRVSKIEMLKSFARSLGVDPEKVILQEAFAEPHRVLVVGDSEEERQAALLSSAIKEALKKEVLEEFPISHFPISEIQQYCGGAARI